MEAKTRHRILTAIWSYVGGSYGYTFAFLAAQPTSVESAQVPMALLAPLWWPLHMAMVLFCTLGNPGGRGSWDAQCTTASVWFIISAIAVVGVIKLKGHKTCGEPNQSMVPPR